MIWNTIQLALREIRFNLMRSILTALGIIIGVAAVIIIVTLGDGATARVTSDISSLGRKPPDRRAGAAWTQWPKRRTAF